MLQEDHAALQTDAAGGNVTIEESLSYKEQRDVAHRCKRTNDRDEGLMRVNKKKKKKRKRQNVTHSH